MIYILPLDYNKLNWKKRTAVREQYINEQEGKCIYCNCSLSKKPPQYILNREIRWDLFPPKFLKYPVHLQHNHDTGMTEGAVHSYCNAVMWQYEGK
jgi:hypothetical protein